MSDETVATRALQPGEQTTEHAVMTEATGFGRILTYVGMISAILPQILDLAKLLPAGLQDSKYVLIATTSIGGLLALLGVIKEVAVKVSYINSRGMIKAAAVRDTPPDTTVSSTDVPK